MMLGNLWLVQSLTMLSYVGEAEMTMLGRVGEDDRRGKQELVMLLNQAL